jgi:hypothetical protein
LTANTRSATFTLKQGIGACRIGRAETSVRLPAQHHRRLPIICARGMKDPKSPATGSAGVNVKVSANSPARARQAAPLLPPQACTYWNKAEQALVKNLDIVPISNRADHWFLQKGRRGVIGLCAAYALIGAPSRCGLIDTARWHA